MSITEKVAYLKGLIEGLGLNDDSKESKIYSVLTDVLQDLALTIEDLDDDMDEVFELVEEIDEDLGNVEEDLYCDYDDDHDCDCDDCHCEDSDEFAVTCPSCGEDVIFDLETLEEADKIDCPFCGYILDFTDEGCDCGCGCGDSKDDACDCSEGNCDCGPECDCGCQDNK